LALELAGVYCLHEKKRFPYEKKSVRFFRLWRQIAFCLDICTSDDIAYTNKFIIRIHLVGTLSNNVPLCIAYIFAEQSSYTILYNNLAECISFELSRHYQKQGCGLQKDYTLLTLWSVFKFLSMRRYKIYEIMNSSVKVCVNI